MKAKVTVIGAGNVGAAVANDVAQKNFTREVVLLDIKEGISEGKGLDIWESAPVLGFNTYVRGTTNNYETTADSDIIVITSGLPRKPGMSRDDLISTNAKIVKDVTEKAIAHSPDAVIIVVSNPLDVMTYAAYKTAKKASHKVFGMAGVLDTSRYRAFLAKELQVAPQDITALLLGGHGDSMVPLPRYTTVSGIPVNQLISDKRLNEIVERTKKGGGEIVNLMGTSAWFAPGAAVSEMVKSVACGENRVLPVCAMLEGEYGMNNIYIGVPVILGYNGIEKILEVEMNEKEQKDFERSAASVREVMKTLDDMNIVD